LSRNPKYTLDWYLKWAACILLLVAMSIRGVDGYYIHDLVLSIVGVFLWLAVSILWNDRALILLNSVGLVLMVRNLFAIN
jgi:hypothetical protein